ncbi:MAG: alpha/beta hydrolase [Planctomycetes bacterium]|nr:alpha/beta hydrolase [Planctomycetota bacterium]
MATRSRTALTLSACFALGMLATACAPTPLDETEAARPATSDLLELTRALGFWDEIARVASTLPEYLFDVPGVDGEGVFEVETYADVRFRETPSGPLTLNIHRPKTSDERLRRTVVLYMGGGFLVDDDFGVVEIWADYLASRGFVAVNTRQRLLTESGISLLDAFSDALAAVRFMAAEGPRFGADPERIGVMGRSSGGQLAVLVGIYPDPDLFREPGDPDAPVTVRAIVDIHGPVDYAPLATGEQFSIVPFPEFLSALGGNPDELPELYAAVSPLSYVRPGLPPIMIVHGMLDLSIPIAQSVELADKLEAAGNTVVREFQPDTGHMLGWGFLHNDGFGRAMSRAVRFFEEHL